jgi:hypothetical protein
MNLGNIAGFALNGIGQDRRLDPRLPRKLCRGIQREGGRGNGANTVAGKHRIVGPRRQIVVAGQ